MNDDQLTIALAQMAPVWLNKSNFISDWIKWEPALSGLSTT